MYQARFPSKRNRLRCVRALRALRFDGNRAKRKRLRWQKAAANRMLGRSTGNHDWLLANESAYV